MLKWFTTRAFNRFDVFSIAAFTLLIHDERYILAFSLLVVGAIASGAMEGVQQARDDLLKTRANA